MKIKVFIFLCLLFLGCNNSNNKNEVEIINDLTKFPNLKYIITGYSGPEYIPESNKREIIYDSTFSKIHILNTETPKNNIYIILKNPDGIEFRKKYDIYDKSLKFIEINPLSNEKYNFPVISIYTDFPSFYKDGIWQFTAILDDVIDTKILNEINIKTFNFYISKEEPQSPLELKNEFVFEDNDYLFINGKYKNKNKNIIIVLYINSIIDKDNKMIVKPIKAYKIRVDSEFKYKLKVLITSDIPKGEYHIAVGEKINQDSFHDLSYFRIEDKKNASSPNSR